MLARSATGHVPPAIANTCTEIDPTAAGALAVANCKPDDAFADPDVYADAVACLSFDADWKTLDAWAARWEELGEPDGEDCAAGPATNVYTLMVKLRDASYADRIPMVDLPPGGTTTG